MTPMEDEEFTAFLRGKAMEAKDTLNYRPTLFLKMLGSSGGYETAISLISSPKHSDGFIKLWEGKRLDLTVEALVAESKWRKFFDCELISSAEKRLSRAGYIVKAPEGFEISQSSKVEGSKNSGAKRVPKFNLGEEYSRSDIFRVLGLHPEPKGGSWFTGYTEYDDNVFIFCNIGAPGRTGHDYENYFDGDRLVWSGKGSSKLKHESIQRLLNPLGYTYIFFRMGDRDPFTFAGVAKPQQEFDTSPVKVIWEFYQPSHPSLGSSVQPLASDRVTEGGVKSLAVKVYERDRGARLKCIRYWGWQCFVCQFDFSRKYGELGEGFIHVHHLKPLAEIGMEYELNPIADLRPVCPNCHAMLHRTTPALAIEELQSRIALAKES